MGLTLEIGRTAVAAADVGPLLQRICSTLPGTLGVPAAAIVLVDLPDTQLAGVTASGPDAARLGEMELRAGTGPVQGAVRSGRAMVTPDLTRIGPPELAAAAADTGLTCSVVVPLRVDGEPAGGLQLFGHPGRPVGDGHVDALAGLADVLSARLSDVCAVRRLTGTVARLTAEHEASLPVAHATGMLAERYRTDPEEAGRFLDSLARKTGATPGEAARSVLDRVDEADLPTTMIAQVPAPRAAQEQGGLPPRAAQPRATSPSGVVPRPGGDRPTPPAPPVDRAPAERAPVDRAPIERRPPERARVEHPTPQPRGTHPSGATPRPGGDRLTPPQRPAEQGHVEQVPVEQGPAERRPTDRRPAGRPTPEPPDQTRSGGQAPHPTGGRRHLREDTPPPPPEGRARHRRADIG